MLDKKLLQILVCPVTKAPLDYDEAKQELVCKASGLAYPVKDGIPVLLEGEARQLTADEKLGGILWKTLSLERLRVAKSQPIFSTKTIFVS